MRAFIYIIYIKFMEADFQNVGGRGILTLTGSVHLSHFEDEICSRFSSPLTQAEQSACSAHKVRGLILCLYCTKLALIFKTK